MIRARYGDFKPMKLDTTSVLKYISVIGAVAAFLCTLKVIPGVSTSASVTILSAAAATYKICDIIENALKTQSPVSPPAPPAGH
jgi:hypothetical protein